MQPGTKTFAPAGDRAPGGLRERAGMRVRLLARVSPRAGTRVVEFPDGKIILARPDEIVVH